MRLFINAYSLLHDGYLNIITLSYGDSMLVPSDAQGMLHYFFEVTVYSDNWWEYWMSNRWPLLPDLDKYWCVDKAGRLSYRGKVLVEGVMCADIADIMILHDYLFILYEINFYRHKALLITTYEGYDFVGFISSCYGTISSPKLSRLIMVTPELDWNV